MATVPVCLCARVPVYLLARVRMQMEDRMTLCNMVIEGGGKNGIVAADKTTFAYLEVCDSVPCCAVGNVMCCGVPCPSA